MRNIIREIKRIISSELLKKSDPYFKDKVDKCFFKKPVLKNGLVIREDGGSYEIFDKQSMKNVLVNKNSELVISKCDGTKTLSQVCEEINSGPLKKKYLEDTALFLSGLHDLGILEWK